MSLTPTYTEDRDMVTYRAACPGCGQDGHAQRWLP